MSPIAIGLLIIAAAIHAGWNLVCKRQHPSQAFFLLADLAGVILLMPVAIIYHGAIVQIPVQVWRLLFLGGCCFALYYLALAGAYRKGDMSIAYPLARSSSILMVVVISLTVGRQHDIGLGAEIGRAHV